RSEPIWRRDGANAGLSQRTPDGFPTMLLTGEPCPSAGRIRPARLDQDPPLRAEQERWLGFSRLEGGRNAVGKPGLPDPPGATHPKRATAPSKFHDRLPARPFEPESAVVLVAVEARLGQGGRAHEDGRGALGAVVIAAEGEQPLGARLGAAAGRGEGR